MKQIFTSATAGKELRALEEKKESLLAMEEQAKLFIAATTENMEDARPPYDFFAATETLRTLDRKVMKIRHALNCFNAVTVLPKAGLTIDQALIRMAQLTNEERRLSDMKNRLPKTRLSGFNSEKIEYRYCNYDPDAVCREFEQVQTEKAALQLEKDTVNVTKEFEVEF